MACPPNQLGSIMREPRETLNEGKFNTENLTKKTNSTKLQNTLSRSS